MSAEATALVPANVSADNYFSVEQRELIHRTVAKGTTKDEFAIFLYQCARTGLDPLSRQIYAIVRNQWDPEMGRQMPKMAIQTGIDGYRVIAERSQRYAPGRDVIFETDDKGKLVKATAYVMKLVAGTWHEVSASAYYEEYVQRKKDGGVSGLWAKPHIMLGKCAEALALRKAFPAEMSGIYTAEEMSQADTPAEYTPPAPTPGPFAKAKAEAESKALEASIAPKGVTASIPKSSPVSPAAVDAGMATDIARGSSPKAPAAAEAAPAALPPEVASAVATVTAIFPDAQVIDTGEAADATDLDALETEIRRNKMAKPYVQAWSRKYFGRLPNEGMTKQQVKDAVSILEAFREDGKDKKRPKYNARIAQLQAAGRIAKPSAA